jgi:hypothetical protein
MLRHGEIERGDKGWYHWPEEKESWREADFEERYKGRFEA